MARDNLKIKEPILDIGLSAESAPEFGGITLPGASDMLVIKFPEGTMERFGEADTLLSEADALQVVNDATCAQATSIAGRARRRLKDLQELVKVALRPYEAAKKELKWQEKEAVAKLQEAVRIAGDKNHIYLERVERRRQAAEAKAKETIDEQLRAGTTLGTTPIVVPPPKTKVFTPDGTQTLETQTVGRVADFRQLPDECFLERWGHIEKAIMPWINQRIKAGITNDPGVVYETQSRLKTVAAQRRGNDMLENYY